MKLQLTCLATVFLLAVCGQASAAGESTAVEIGNYEEAYTPATRIHILAGRIVGARFVMLDEKRQGTIAKVHIGGEIVDVFLGPTKYLQDNNIPVEIGAPVVINGQIVKINDQVVVLASTIRMYDEVYALRNESGHPVWIAGAE